MNDQVSAPAEVEKEVEQAQPERESSTFIDFNALPEDIAPVIKERIGQDTRRYKKLETQYDKDVKAREAEIQELKQKLHEVQKPVEVGLPDQYLYINDPEKFNQRVEAHAKSIAAQKDWERQQESIQQEQQRRQQEAFNQTYQSFAERAVNAGLDQVKMAAAEQQIGVALQNNPNSYQLSNFLLAHETGPQLVQELYDNPAVLNEIASCDAITAGVKLNELSKKFKPKIETETPPPVEPLNGSGAKPTGKYDRFIGKGRFVPA